VVNVQLVPPNPIAWLTGPSREVYAPGGTYDGREVILRIERCSVHVERKRCARFDLSSGKITRREGWRRQVVDPGPLPDRVSVLNSDPPSPEHFFRRALGHKASESVAYDSQVPRRLQSCNNRRSTTATRNAHATLLGDRSNRPSSPVGAGAASTARTSGAAVLSPRRWYVKSSGEF